MALEEKVARLYPEGEPCPIMEKRRVETIDPYFEIETPIDGENRKRILQLMVPLLAECKKHLPELFGDIGPKEGHSR